MNDDRRTAWKVLSRFVEIKSPWLTVIGERLLDDAGKELEYWRVEKADSLVVLVIQDNRLLLPKSMYRPGVGRLTLDFCGGRMDSEKNIEENVRALLRKEFAIDEKNNIGVCTQINTVGWDVNSSFENQQLYGVTVELPRDLHVDENNIGSSYELNEAGIDQLLTGLRCLQCRALFLDWLRKR